MSIWKLNVSHITGNQNSEPMVKLNVSHFTENQTPEPMVKLNVSHITENQTPEPMKAECEPHYREPDSCAYGS